MRNLSEFGRFARIKRIEKSVLLYEMADALGVSSAMLSGVETGRKNFPADWEVKVVDFFELDAAEKQELKAAIELDKRGVSDRSGKHDEVRYYAEARRQRRGKDAA